MFANVYYIIRNENNHIFLELNKIFTNSIEFIMAEYTLIFGSLMSKL